MKRRHACATLLALALARLPVAAAPLPPAPALPADALAQLPPLQAGGEATMRFLGFAVYQAGLWTAPGFAEGAWGQSALALELTYLRAFQGADIARRSLAEMRRQGAIDEATGQRWEAQMRALFPDVQAGDRITGVNIPGNGARFWHNGRPLGELREAEFARLFFGIWLAPQTSEPQLRAALLAPLRARPGSAP